MGEVGNAYAGCRHRIRELAGSLSPEEEDALVPGCPEWTVHDVVAHVAGVVDDVMAGRLEGIATDPWTAAQVEARRGRPIRRMLQEWDAGAPGFEALLDQVGDPGRQAVTDIATHEHDLRGALGAPGARDSDAVHMGFGFVAPLVVSAAAGHGVALRVEAAGGSVAGGPDATVVLRGTAFELLRAMTGRRSLEQVRALDWAGDPDPVLAAFTYGPFRPAASTVEE